VSETVFVALREGNKPYGFENKTHVMFKLKKKAEKLYTGCPRRNVPVFGRVFLMLKYTDITQNTYIQS
jgi:hypothetical protein